MVLGGMAETATVRDSSSWERASSKGTKGATDPVAVRLQGLKGELQRAEERVSSCSQGVEVSWEQSTKRLSSMESGLEVLTDRLTVLNNQVQTMTDCSTSNISVVETGVSSDANALMVASAFEKLEQQLGLLHTQVKQRMKDLTNRVDELAKLKLVDNQRLDALEQQLLDHTQKLEEFQVARSCQKTNADGGTLETDQSSKDTLASLQSRMDALAKLVEQQLLDHTQRLEQFQIARSCQKTNADGGTLETDQSSKDTLASLQSRMDALAKLISTEGQLREASISRLEWHCRQVHDFPQQPQDQEHCTSTPDASPNAVGADAVASNLEAYESEGPAAATTASDPSATCSPQPTARRISGVPSQASGSEFCNAVGVGGAVRGNAPDDAAVLSELARADPAVPPPDNQLDRTSEAVVFPVTLLSVPPSKNNAASSPAPRPSNSTLPFTSPPIRWSSVALPPTTSESEGWPLTLSQRAVTALAGSPSHTTVTPLSASPDRLRTDVRVTRSSSVPQFAAVQPASQLSLSRLPQPLKGGTSSAGRPSAAGGRDDEPVHNERRKLFDMAPEPGPWQAISPGHRTLSSTHGRSCDAGEQSRGCLLASTNSPPLPQSSWSGCSQGVQLPPVSTLLRHATATALSLAPDTAAVASPSPVHSSRHLGTGIRSRSWSSPLPICPTPVPSLPGPTTAAGF